LPLPLLLGRKKFPVIEKQLSNGMRMLMVPREDEPTIFRRLVGARRQFNERPGITGIALFSEHMMFKGLDGWDEGLQKDLEIHRPQERVREENAPGRKENPPLLPQGRHRRRHEAGEHERRAGANRKGIQ